MAGGADHVLLTRFNLPSKGFEGMITAKEGWLTDRIALFEFYCLPSVRAQTNQGFHWIIYFDPESPEWLKRRVQNHADEGVYVPIFRPSVSNADLVADIARVTGGHGTRLITTNLDSDDGLAIDFVDRLQATGPLRDRTAVYLSWGLIKSGSRLYLRLDRNNAFASVVENWSSPSTCWSNWQLVSDILVAQPLRLARESGRALVKGVVFRLLGKKGLDKVKDIWASRVGRKLPL